jgi:hypothetical protein
VPGQGTRRIAAGYALGTRLNLRENRENQQAELGTDRHIKVHFVGQSQLKPLVKSLWRVLRGGSAAGKGRTETAADSCSWFQGAHCAGAWACAPGVLELGISGRVDGER